ncbi:hypothetical protein [Marinivivus vitaminiproducens]|uniref:GspE/PulE/PilB domain-containing protein n=1 Tax=Marinivivus vitaminiproducens TaxID=3035935 RepID=UPI0027AAC597|nr:glycosyltransferase family 2 protein [Geminicoccaceae bacterium SCSIO 64248]
MPGTDKDLPLVEQPAAPEPIGQLLRRKGLVTAAELGDALATQKTWGSRLGEVLIGKGYVTAQQFCRILAEQTGADFVDLMRQPPEAGLVDPAERHAYVERHFLPWRREGGTLVLATSDPHPGLLEWAAAHYRCPVAQVVTSPYDINWQIQTLLGADAGRARLRVSAGVAWTWRLVCIALLLASAGLASFAPAWMAAAAVGAAISGSVVVRLVAIGIARRGRDRVDELPVVEYGHGRPLADDQLPVYSLLVPLGDRQEDVAALADTLRRLDYPRSKLDVKLVVDAADDATLDAIKRLRLESFFEIVRVPDAGLGEAHMLSYALDFARGEYVAVYDGGTMPEADQLRRAVAAFTKRRGRYGILVSRCEDGQPGLSLTAGLSGIARLNRTDNIEPGLVSLGLPVPFGRGTHLSAASLRRLGGWRTGHLRPDDELGVRAALAGETVGLLQSATGVASPSSWPGLVRQRRRRMAAGLQTWPGVALAGAARRRLGLRARLMLQIVLLGPFLGAALDALLLALTGLAVAGGLGGFSAAAAVAAPLALGLGALAPLLECLMVERWRRRDYRPAMALAMPLLQVADLMAAGPALMDVLRRPRPAGAKARARRRAPSRPLRPIGEAAAG